MNSKREIRIGIIGVGMIGVEHIRGFKVIPRCKVFAIADPDEGRLKKVSAEHSIPLSFKNYKELLDHEEIDGVVICAPPFAHEEIATAALKAGKHVLTEKPMAPNPAAAKRINRIAKRAGLWLGSCSCRFRFSPTVMKAKEIVESGDLGEIYHISMSGVSRRNRPGIDYHVSAAWNLDKSKSGGGAVMDWGIYDLNILFWLFPDLSVNAIDGFCFQGVDDPQVGDLKFDVEEHGAALLRCSKGINVMWERAWAAHMNRQPRIRIYGSQSGLAFDPVAWSRDVFFEIYEDRSGKPVTIAPDTDFDPWNVHISMASDFVSAIQKNRAPITTGEEEVKFLDIIYALYKSNQKKTSVRV
ncbi:MAG: Gfo/Idh/MocA family oxidoreductase [Candidatus Hinthialibacter antarcticus]|nr:Gfo/Idh/MocA family oxidoreductase [Candidatus Hinthialibacter antarcticus]